MPFQIFSLIRPRRSAGKSHRKEHNMPMYRVLLSYNRLGDAALDGYACGVVLSLTGNPGFLTPLVPLAALATAQQEFHDAWLASLGGGVILTLVKNQKK